MTRDWQPVRQKIDFRRPEFEWSRIVKIVLIGFLAGYLLGYFR
mgnify:CR=1 FL=1